MESPDPKSLFMFEWPGDDFDKYYQIGVYCANCDKHDAIYIRKGVRKSSLIVNCRNCECKLNL